MYETIEGRWTNALGELVTIKRDRASWDSDGLTASLDVKSRDEFALLVDGVGKFHCRRSSSGQLIWSDGDVWTRAKSEREVEAARSRKRIAAAGDCWHAVLDVAPSSSIEEVRRAFRNLALLHHPDKGLEADTAAFRAVQCAYEQGQREQGELVWVGDMLVQSEGSAVAAGASKGELRQALDRWETSLDDGSAGLIPDEVESVPLEVAVELLQQGLCVPVDVRQPEEKYGTCAAPLPGAVQLGYMALLKSPETVVQHVAELQRRTSSGSDGRRVLAYSTHGGTRGNCSVVCCALVDVFGFSSKAVCTLEDGYLQWKKWRDANKSLVANMSPAS